MGRRDDAADDFRQCLVYDPSLAGWLEQQQRLIPEVQRQSAQWLAWYEQTIRDAVRNRNDFCGDRYGETGSRVANCRSAGVNDTEAKIQRGDL